MLGAVLVTEFRKLRHSKITWLTWLAFSIMPIIGGVFLWIIKEPERSKQFGLLGEKAQFMSISADWPGYFTFLLQVVGVGGMVLVSIITAYVFGREYAEGTAKNMLALPVSRYWFTAAKLIVVWVWFFIVVLLLFIEGLLVCTSLGLTNFSISLVIQSVKDIFIMASIVWLLAPAVAWVSIVGKGYFAPLAFTILTLVLGNLFGATAWGKWFPWSIVPLFSGIAGPRVDTLASGSLLILLMTFIVCVTGTVLQIRYADNYQ